MGNQTLLVNRRDLSDLVIYDQLETELPDGGIRVKTQEFAFTSNNVTYMVTGDLIGYWKFFDPKAYGMDPKGSGRMPVWGYAEVIESNCDDIKVGEGLYGFFPITQTFDMMPDRISKSSFLDGAEHRRELHVIYNQYIRTDADPSFPKALHSLQPILRPLFTTSFLIDDQFYADNYYSAEQIVVLSASSKTALGTAFCLKARGDIEVVGLTSARNKGFVEKTGFYGRVETYEDVWLLDASKKTAIIDMAGNGAVTASLYEHMGENIVYNCMVGKSHWKGEALSKPAAGAPPTMFFAPDRARIRIAEWGPDGFAARLAAVWLPFCRSARDWLEIEKGEGIDALLPVYKEFLEGRADPAKGYLFTV